MDTAEQGRLLLMGTARPIVKWLHDLRKPSAAVSEVGLPELKILGDMAATLRTFPGKLMGLAAVQIGEPVRLVVIKCNETQCAVMANPKVVWASDDKSTMDEACLSIPGVQKPVRRPNIVKVDFLDVNGEPRSEHFKGLMARIVQHEIDHTDGILFIDRSKQLILRPVVGNPFGVEQHAHDIRPIYRDA